MRKLSIGVLAAGLILQTNAGVNAQEMQLRVAGTFSGNMKHVEIESPFFANLGTTIGMNLRTTYNPQDVLGIKSVDAFRLLRSGAFDIFSVPIGTAARDEPSVEGLDLIGVSTNLVELRAAVNAYREVFDKRLQEKFNAKVLTLYAFGPQMLFCNSPIRSLDDLKGLKVRSFTPSMSAALESLGATPVTLQFSEVYPALQRGVASCGITSPTSASTAKWPEVTNFAYPLTVSGAVNGHFINLNSWSKFKPDEQRKLTAAFQELERKLWDFTTETNQDALNCAAGKEPCRSHTKYKMEIGAVSKADEERIRAIAQSVILPQWKKTCDAVYPSCSAVWNETVGRARGLAIR